jgi:hypothetical protein
MFALAMLAAAMADQRFFLAPSRPGYEPTYSQYPAGYAAPLPPTAARAAPPTMILQETAVVVPNYVPVTTLVATSAGDFGGYTIPIIGLVTLAATIFLLAGPVED